MKKHFLLLSLITLGLFSQSLFSQATIMNMDTLKSRIENIPYIFKGEIIDIQYYLGDENGNKLEGTYYLLNGELGVLYSSAKVQICQILKGENKLKPGTIEIITSSPYLVQPYLYSTEKGDTAIGLLKGSFCSGCVNPIFIDKKYSAIFFCQEAIHKGKSKYQFDNSFGIYPSTLGTPLIYSNWKKGMTYSGFNWANKKFYSPTELLMYLKQFNLYTNAYDFCNEEIKINEKLKNDSINKLLNDSINKIRYQQNKRNYNEWMEKTIKIHNIDTAKTKNNKNREQLKIDTDKKRKNTKGGNLNFEIFRFEFWRDCLHLLYPD
jgi:hypothetical protein